MISSFLPLLEKAKLGSYVSWKNNHEIDLSLSGDSDLDIYIPLKLKSDFINLAQADGWINVENPVAHYPNIYHFYKVDKNLKNYHLHVYFEVNTGESWLKEYNFPIGDFLLANRVKHESGIYILNNKAQAYLFGLRHLIKNKSIFSRILYEKEFSSYQDEWNLCKSDFQPAVYSSFFNLEPYLPKSGLESKLELPDRSVARQARIELEKYLRFDKNKLFSLRFQSFFRRLFNKLYFKRKKTLPRQGFILAFSGADGVGKSTMSETIGNAYANFLTVKTVQLGKPQSALVEKIRGLLNKPSSQESKQFKLKPNKNISFKKAVTATVLARMRYKEANKALKYRKQNYLIISDRWPTTEIGKMDGPQLIAKDLKGLKKWLAKKEQKYYELIPEADLCITLTVPTEIAIQRNRDRIKEGKETDEEIIMRHQQNAEHQPKAKELIRFDNDGQLIPKRLELIKIIQSKLFQN